MTRRDNAARRCPTCRVLDGCICDLVRPVATKTRVVVVIHRDEARKTTNTGLLAVRCLTNAASVVVDDAPPAPLAIDPGYTPVVLAPAEGARLLDDVAALLTKPACLIVPDGTWRQARKLRKRVPGMDAWPCALLPPGAPTAYRLRTERHEGGLATLEAIERALAILGDDVGDALSAPFRAFVTKTLASRGIT